MALYLGDLFPDDPYEEWAIARRDSLRGSLGGEARFTTLETVREYTSEQLAEKGEMDAFQVRHAQFYLSLTERRESVWFTAELHYWLERFNAEHYNCRATLTWAFEHDSGIAVRPSGALWRYWLARGCLTEGRSWFDGAIAMVPKQKAGSLTYDRAARQSPLRGGCAGDPRVRLRSCQSDGRSMSWYGSHRRRLAANGQFSGWPRYQRALPRRLRPGGRIARGSPANLPRA